MNNNQKHIEPGEVILMTRMAMHQWIALKKQVTSDRDAEMRKLVKPIAEKKRRQLAPLLERIAKGEAIDRGVATPEVAGQPELFDVSVSLSPEDLELIRNPLAGLSFED